MRLAGAYIDEQVDVKRGAADTTTGWLSQRIHDLSQQLQIQEGAVESYKAHHGLTDTAPGNSLVDQQLVGINSQVVQARSDVAEKQAAYDRVNQLAASGDAADVSAVVSSPLIVQLRTQEAQLLRDEGDLQSKYGPLHPKLQALEEQKRDLDTKIADEVRRNAAAAGNDLVVAKAHLQSLEQSLGGARGELTSQNYARVQLQALESNAASTRTQYEAFVGRLRQTQDQDTIATPESRIISPAAVPLNPSAPKRSLIVAASLPLGLMLGLLIALCAEKWRTLQPLQVNGAPRAAMIAPHRFGVQAMPPRPARSKPRAIPIPTPVWQGPPILVDINDNASLKAGDDMLEFPKSAYAHHMAALVRQLESRPLDGQKSAAAVVAVTAAEGGENKSAIGVSLARAATLMGKKTLLVDCDPAQSAAGAMKASCKAGLYDVLTGAVPLSKALSKDGRTNAHVLAMRKTAAQSCHHAGLRPDEPADRRAARRLRHGGDRLRPGGRRAGSGAAGAAGGCHGAGVAPGRAVRAVAGQCREHSQQRQSRADRDCCHEVTPEARYFPRRNFSSPRAPLIIGEFGHIRFGDRCQLVGFAHDPDDIDQALLMDAAILPGMGGDEIFVCFFRIGRLGAGLLDQDRNRFLSCFSDRRAISPPPSGRAAAGAEYRRCSCAQSRRTTWVLNIRCGT